MINTPQDDLKDGWKVVSLFGMGGAEGMNARGWFADVLEKEKQRSCRTSGSFWRAVGKKHIGGKCAESPGSGRCRDDANLEGAGICNFGALAPGVGLLARLISTHVV